MRCLDADGDTDGDNELEYENCYFIVNPTENYQGAEFLDAFDDSDFPYNLEETAGIKYTLSLYYPNNNYWGSAFGNYYFENNGGNTDTLGDLNFDGIINVIDIVSMVNGILGGSLTSEELAVADMNSDGIVNVIDIVLSLIHI